MRAIDKAKAHFNSLETKRIEVPEWGDENEPLVIFVKPSPFQKLQSCFNYLRAMRLKCWLRQ